MVGRGKVSASRKIGIIVYVYKCVCTNEQWYLTQRRDRNLKYTTVFAFSTRTIVTSSAHARRHRTVVICGVNVVKVGVYFNQLFLF